MNSKSTIRELRACLIAALAYLITTWVCVWLLKHSLLDAPLALRGLASLVPLIPIGLAVRAVVKLVRAGDELQRRIDLEALAISAVLVGMGCLTLSFLLLAEVVDFSAREALTWVFPAQWIVYGLARFHAQRRYQ